MGLTVGPPAIVVDASAAIEFLTRNDERVEATWSRWVAESTLLLAPSHVVPEVANGLLRSVRLPANDVASLLGGLAESGLETTDAADRAIREVVMLADRHRLTVYDAAYLWLAIDIEGELATLDRALVAAAKAEDIPLAI